MYYKTRTLVASLLALTAIQAGVARAQAMSDSNVTVSKTQKLGRELRSFLQSQVDQSIASRASVPTEPAQSISQELQTFLLDSNVKPAQGFSFPAYVPDLTGPQPTLPPTPQDGTLSLTRQNNPQLAQTSPYRQRQLPFSRYFRDLPPLLLDLHEGSNQTVVFSRIEAQRFYVQGRLTSGTAGTAGATFAFEQGGIAMEGPDDFISITGTGVDTNSDGFVDRFDMSEPLPPSEVPTNPGPGFVYDGGTVTYVGNLGDTDPAGNPYADDEFWLAEYSFSQLVEEFPGLGGVAVRRIKIAENNSPMPRDRLFFDYRFFNDVRNGLGDVSRYTFGVEKTIFAGEASIEARFPFAATLDSIQTDGSVFSRDFEMGNFVFTYKHALAYTDRGLISSGLGVSIPTGDGTKLFQSTGEQIVNIENQSVHILPYIAGLWTPNSKSWLQGFAQLDIDANGDTVSGDVAGGELPHLGVLHDSTWMFFDVAAGRWIYEGNGAVQRVGLITELHYNSTLSDADLVTGNGITVTDFSNRLDVLNGTAGIHVVYNRLAFTTGVTVPLRTDDDRQMDFEVAALVNAAF